MKNPGNVARRRPVGAALAGAISALLTAGAQAAEESREFDIYGFAQADFIQDIGGRLNPDWEDAFRP